MSMNWKTATDPSDQTLALHISTSASSRPAGMILPGADRYAWITPDFAVGSTSAHYGPQDREVASPWI